MTSYAKCKTCQELVWITSSSHHKCKPIFYVKITDNRYGDFYDYKKVYALDAGEAAEKFVDKWDEIEDLPADDDNVEVTVLTEKEYLLLMNLEDEMEEDSSTLSSSIPKGITYLVDGYFVATYRAKEKINMKNYCPHCRWFATEDQGYSNYTVTETIAHCLKNLNPGMQIDESYSWEYGESLEGKVFMFAETCESYLDAGNKQQINLDVDGEITIEDYRDDTELYDVAKKYFK